MTAALQTTRGTQRSRARDAARLLVLPMLMGLAACQAAAPSPIVYTAPPDILNRTYPPTPSDSAVPSAGSPLAPSPVASSAPGSSVSVGRPEPGAIVFGTGVGTDSCSVANPSEVLLSTQPFFFAARLVDQMDGSRAIVLNIVKDGQLLLEHEEPADGKAFDCYGNTSSLGSLRPGAYDFTVRLGTVTEAEGRVTVR
jgi:hypothetical protein